MGPVDTKLDPGLILRVAWLDEDVVELIVSASNGRFRGATSCHVRPSFFQDLARQLEGFPQSPDDVREARIGVSETGFVELRMLCIDGVGHPVALIGIVASGRPHEERVDLTLPLSAAGIDELVGDLSASEVTVGRELRLPMESH